MDLILSPAHLEGTVRAPASKSLAQRLIILAALADKPTFLSLDSASQDIAATVRCLRALGARVKVVERRQPNGEATPGILVGPLPRDPSGRPVALSDVELDCGESGATLRFLLPVVGALGVGATLMGTGRLPERPLAPLDTELRQHGLKLRFPGARALPLRVFGQLEGGRFTLPGDVTSQFASGLLLAAPLLDGAVEVRVMDPFESRPYVTLTCQALANFGVNVVVRRLDTVGATGKPITGSHVTHATIFQVGDAETLRSPGELAVEGDWSQAAFWLCAGALGAQVEVQGLNLKSLQGDRSVMAALALLGVRVIREPNGCLASCPRPRAATFDVADTPDLVPPLAAVCALAEGTSTIRGARRLRLKESDRLQSVTEALTALGGSARIEGDDLVIEGVESLRGGVVDTAGDHRIAMMAAICALRATGPVTILDADCVAKSYPAFFHHYRALGGNLREA